MNDHACQRGRPADLAGNNKRDRPSGIEHELPRRAVALPQIPDDVLAARRRNQRAHNGVDQDWRAGFQRRPAVHTSSPQMRSRSSQMRLAATLASLSARSPADSSR